MNSATKPDYAAFIGIDWAFAEHAIALYEPTADTIEESALSSNPNAIQAWASNLEERFKDPLNPVTSARFRKAFTPSGAKDASDVATSPQYSPATSRPTTLMDTRQLARSPSPTSLRESQQVC